MSTDLHRQLDDWVRAGLVSAEQADAIAEHEHRRTPDAARDRPGRTTAAEAIGYVGAALVLGAVGLFVGEFWDGLTAGGKLALAALVTVALTGAAWSLRRAATPALSRLTSVLCVGVVAGVAWTVTIAADDLLSWSSDDVALAVGIAVVAVAIPLYLLRPTALPQLTALAAVISLLSAVLLRPDLALATFWYALPYAALGTVWLLLAEGGYLRPRRVGSAVGALVALLALQAGSFDGHRLLALALAVAAAAALVAFAVAGGELHHLAVGAVGLFVIVPQVVFELFGDAIGAPATLLLVGVLLVLLAVGLGRARREVVTGGAA